MKKKNILLCVSGGIAAYKAIDLCSRLYKLGYEIRTILTDGACKFVSELNFAAISHYSTHTSLWEDSDPIPHINLADWADLMIVAPATANVMAKAAHGLADDLLSATILAHTKPVLYVPAMNVHMYENEATQANIAVLKARGHYVLEPDTGMLACAYEGKGKYPPNSQVVLAIQTYLAYKQDLIGLSIMVTAGATKEDIDPMRHISNKSSGKMGFALATAAALRGATVTLIHGDSALEIPYLVAKTFHTPDVDSMHKACMEEAPAQDWIIKCAAVSDYRPDTKTEHKIKKSDELQLRLVKTVDILLELGRTKRPGQLLIGFAAETDELQANALKKLQAKNLDLIVANDLRVSGKDETEAIVFCSKGEYAIKGSKFEAAHSILDVIKNYAQ
jgi:phosphopantothenoylcysteine decarboxylase/phosphopantothenate--cysteine ligase